MLANGNVSLSDEHSGVMDGKSNVSLHHEGLETSFHELGDGKTKDVIELALRFVEETETDHTADEGITFKLSSWIVLIHGEQDTGGLSELGEDELGSPDLFFASESVVTDQLEIVDKLLLLEGSSGVLGDLGIIRVLSWHF